MVTLPAPIQTQVPPAAKRETHRLMLLLTDPRSGRSITKGTVSARVIAPDKKVQTRGLMLHGERFVADLEMGNRGRYAVSVDFVLRDRKLRSARFWYVVK